MYIKDNITGVVRLYGTDCHDSLEISEDGKHLSYYNLQCGEGSKYGSYSFVTDENGTLPRDDEDLVKHGAEAFFNIGGFDAVLKELKSNIEWLIDQYDQSIMLLEEDIKENPIGNTFNIGRLKAEKEIREHLTELLDESNYEG